MNREQRQSIAYFLMVAIVLGSTALIFAKPKKYVKPTVVAHKSSHKPHGVLPAHWKNVPVVVASSRAPVSVHPSQEAMVASELSSNESLFGQKGPLGNLSIAQRKVIQKNILQSVDRRIRLGQIQQSKRQYYIRLSVMDLSMRLIARQNARR